MTNLRDRPDYRQAKSRLSGLVRSLVKVDRLVLKTMGTAEGARIRFSLRHTQHESGGIAAFPTR
jgi:hypothetical protein